MAEKLASGPALGRWLQLSISSAALDHARSPYGRATHMPLFPREHAARDDHDAAELADFWALACETLDELAPLVLRCYVAGVTPATLMRETGMAPSEIYNLLRNGRDRLRRRGPQLLHAYTGEAA